MVFVNFSVECVLIDDVGGTALKTAFTNKGPAYWE